MESLRSPRQRRMEDFLSPTRSSLPSRSSRVPSTGKMLSPQRGARAAPTVPSDESPSASLASFFGRASEISSPSTPRPKSGEVDVERSAVGRKRRCSNAEILILHASALTSDEDSASELNLSSPVSADISSGHSTFGCVSRLESTPTQESSPSRVAKSADTRVKSPFLATDDSSHEIATARVPLRTYSRRRLSTTALTDCIAGSNCEDKTNRDKENVVPAAAAANSHSRSSSGHSSKITDTQTKIQSPRHFQASRTLIQTRLDLGQKQVAGDPRHCPQCGMMYTPGDETDEACHRRFHSAAEDALKFPGWKKEDVVLENPDGSRVICVLPSAPSHMLNKMKAVQAIMDEELGAHESSGLLQHGRKAYLYISAKSPQQQIRGVCVAESIICGYRMLGGRGGEEGVAAADVTVSDEPEPASCGIYRLWVCRTGRRQGIATCLLNAVRMHCIPGRYISKDRLAFSDPTVQGKLFASSYTNNKQFLIYK